MSELKKHRFPKDKVPSLPGCLARDHGITRVLKETQSHPAGQENSGEGD